MDSLCKHLLVSFYFGKVGVIRTRQQDSALSPVSVATDEKSGDEKMSKTHPLVLFLGPLAPAGRIHAPGTCAIQLTNDSIVHS